MNYKVFALIVMGITFLFDTLMHYLDTKSAEREIPANVADIYDAEEYKRWLAYDKECNKLSLWRHLVSYVVALSGSVLRKMETSLSLAMISLPSRL